MTSAFCNASSSAAFNHFSTINPEVSPFPEEEEALQTVYIFYAVEKKWGQDAYINGSHARGLLLSHYIVVNALQEPYIC